MTKVIWKYVLCEHKYIMSDIYGISMPIGAQILTVNKQNDLTCIWALVDPDAPLCLREFVMVGTGHDIIFEGKIPTYIGSIQRINGALVFHVFELNNECSE